MKKTVLLLAAILLSGAFYAQEADEKVGQNFDVKTTQEAHFAEGDLALMQYFYNNITFSEEAKKQDLEGEIKVSFTVLPDGSLSDISILKGMGHGLDERVAELLGTIKFEPAMQNGTKVPSSVIYSIPLQAM